MILIDDRAGSGPLAAHIKGSQLCRLEYGDASFGGNGPDGPVLIGIEVKTVSDILSCIHDGRFAGHQLPGMQDAYDYIWLIINGEYRAENPSGLLQIHGGGRKRWTSRIGPRRYMYRDFDSWLISIETRGHMRVRQASNNWGVARIIKDLYRWWNLKQYDEHRAHISPHVLRGPLAKASLVQKMASQLPGVGMARSIDVAKRFKNVAEMVAASSEDWVEIPGIGKGISEKVVREMHKKTIE